MSLKIITRFNFSNAIASDGPGKEHTTQRIAKNAVNPAVFNEYERLFGIISTVIGDYAYSDVIPGYPVNKNNIGDIVRFLYSDYRELTTSLDTRKYDKQGGTITGDVIMTKSLTVNSGFKVTAGDIVLSSKLLVNGESTFNAKVELFNELVSYSSINVKLDSTFKNSLLVTKTLTAKDIVSETLSCSDDVSVGDLLTANSLSVTKTSSFTENISGTTASFSGQITSTYTAGQPFVISSNVMVENLNANYLADKAAGNDDGNIPINNGTKCVNLHADRLDDHDAGNDEGQIPVSNGSICTTLNADRVDDYHVQESNEKSTIVARDASCGINVGSINCSGDTKSESLTINNDATISGKLSIGNMVSGSITLTGETGGKSYSDNVSLTGTYFSDPNNYNVIVSPATNPGGNLGEFWVDKQAGYFVIHISGSYPLGTSVVFNYIAVAYI